MILPYLNTLEKIMLLFFIITISGLTAAVGLAAAGAVF